MEFGLAIPYDIIITASANKGFVVKVGCCRCTFTNKTELLRALEEYLSKPQELEKAFNEAMLEGDQPICHEQTSRGPHHDGPCDEARDNLAARGAPTSSRS